MSMIICSASLLLMTVATRKQVSLAVLPAMSNACPSITLGGYLGNRLAQITRNWLLVAPSKNPAILEMFDTREALPPRDLLPWSGEFAGKYLTSATAVYALTHDPLLKKQISQFVRQFISYQTPEGYLGPFPKRFRLTATAPNIGGSEGDSWDVWGHYHAMIGLLRWDEAVGDPKASACAAKIGDLLCERFSANGAPVSSVRNPGMNQAVVHSLAILFRKTGEKRYLDLAQRIVSDFASDGAGDYVRLALSGKEFFELPNQGPRWESLHSIMGLAELFWITGNTDYRKAFIRVWDSIERLDRHNNGGFSSGEQAQGDPYDPRPIET